MARRSPANERERFLVVRSIKDVDERMDFLRASAARVKDWIGRHEGDPFDLLRQMKFEKIGVHPIEARPLNLIEQLNQTWTYAVALAAARELLKLHPDAGGFNVAPGAHMALPLDIMSVSENLVGAETFAAVDPRNNRKLSKDLAKLAARPELHRYVFFCSPRYPELARRQELEGSGEVQVWSVALEVADQRRHHEQRQVTA